jgi:hypothetical protein
MKRQLTAFVLAFALLVSVVPTAAFAADSTTPKKTAYTDLTADWYRSSVEKYGYQAIFGLAEGCFYPNRTITRMEFSRMLHEALNININYFAATNIRDYFDDVNNSDIGASELYDLVTVGIIAQGGSFKPDDALTREMMIHYIINALNYVTGGDYATILLMPEPFADDADITVEYKNNIVLAVVMKLVNGRGNNMLYPKLGATRAEAAVLTDRLVGLCADLTSDVDVTINAEKSQTSLKLIMTVTNAGDKPVTINHSSGWQYDFMLLDSKGNSLYIWSADKMFITASTKTEIPAGGSVKFAAELDSAVYETIKGKIAQVKGWIIGTSENFRINESGYTADITA